MPCYKDSTLLAWRKSYLSSIEKEDVLRVLKKIKMMNKDEPDETRIAVQITIFGYLIMVIGIVCWFLIYFSWMSVTNLFFLTLLGSCLFGIVIFFTSIGNFFYFKYHQSSFPRHWTFNAFSKTLTQFYSWGSLIMIFFSSQSLFLILNVEFIILFLFFCIPVFLSYPLFRQEKVRLWFENFIINRANNLSNVSIET
jgi:amino acid transporter